MSSEIDSAQAPTPTIVEQEFGPVQQGEIGKSQYFPPEVPHTTVTPPPTFSETTAVATQPNGFDKNISTAIPASGDLYVSSVSETCRQNEPEIVGKDTMSISGVGSVISKFTQTDILMDGKKGKWNDKNRHGKKNNVDSVKKDRLKKEHKVKPGTRTKLVGDKLMVYYKGRWIDVTLYNPLA